VSCDVRALDVEVRVEEGDAIKADVNLRVSSSSRHAARRWLESRTPRFEDRADALDITVAGRKGGVVVFGSLRTRGRLTLTVPPQCRLEITTSSGDVSIRGDSVLRNPTHLRTASGDALVAGGVDELAMHTASGDLRVERRPLSRLEFTSASGDLRVRRGCGDAVLKTASGDLRLSGLVGSLSARTASGDIIASWTATPPRIEVGTASGDVSLELPKDIALRGSVTTRSGEIRSSFAGTGGRRGRSLHWDEGQSAIEISSASGDVRIRRGGRSDQPDEADTPVPAERSEI
jgi:DUF4097 and DUF4098 domain-containing protein YvlB